MEPLNCYCDCAEATDAPVARTYGKLSKPPGGRGGVWVGREQRVRREIWKHYDSLTQLRWRRVTSKLPAVL